VVEVTKRKTLAAEAAVEATRKVAITVAEAEAATTGIINLFNQYIFVTKSFFTEGFFFASSTDLS
jgi:hypothetical protein